MASVRAFERSGFRQLLDISATSTGQPGPALQATARPAARPDVPTPRSAAVSYIAAPALLTRAWARLSGRAFSTGTPVSGSVGVLGLLPTYLRCGLNGVVETLWRDQKNRASDISYGWIANQLVVCLRTPELVHQAFGANSEQTSRLLPDYAGPFIGIYRIFGDTLFTYQGEQMRQARQLVLHRFFLKRTLAAHFDDMLRCADHHLDRMAQAPEGIIADVGKTMVAFTMDTWCRAQLGIAALPPAAALRLSATISDCEALATSAKQLVWRGVLGCLGIRKLQHADGREAALRATLRRALQEEILEPHRQHLETTDNLLTALADVEKQAGRDASFNSETIFSQLCMLLLTGHESAASLLTWAFYELARNPRVASAVREEIALHSGNNTPTMATMASMTYLDHLLDEVLRLHPSAPYLGRTVTEPFSLQTNAGPVVVPKQAVLATSIIAQHQSTTVWGDDAASFRPERFAEIPRQKIEKQFMPFSVGNRRCAGYPFALLEAKTFLVRFFQRYDFSIADVDQVESAYYGVLKTKAPMAMQVVAAAGAPVTS